MPWKRAALFWPAPVRACMYSLGATGLFLLTITLIITAAATTTNNATPLSLARATTTQLTVNWVLWALDFLRYLCVFHACLGLWMDIWGCMSLEELGTNLVCATLCGIITTLIHVAECMVFVDSSRRMFAFGAFIHAPRVDPPMYVAISTLSATICLGLRRVQWFRTFCGKLSAARSL